MLHKAKTSSGSTTSKSVISLFLAAWLLFLPLMAGIHQLFAPHAHRFCPLHKVFEDVPIEDTGPFVDQEPTCKAACLLPTNWPTDKNGAAYNACELSNFNLHRTGLPGETVIIRDARGSGQDNASVCSILFRGRPVLELAPKHSPPFSA